MAEGGEAESFCSKENMHGHDCEYFSDGGMAGSSLPEGFEVDQAPAQAAAPSSGSSLPPGFELDKPSAGLPEGFELDKAPGDNVDESKYGGLGQQALAAVEGAGQGVLGPVATGLELGAHKLGLDQAIGLDTSSEAIKGRADTNPWTHGVSETAGVVGSLLTGVGEAGFIAKGASKILPIAEEAGLLARAGSTALRGFIENGLIQGGDEVSKAMLGQGDPEAPVSSALVHMGAAGLFGGTLGLAGSSVSALRDIAATKLAGRLEPFIAGFGAAAQGLEHDTSGYSKNLEGAYKLGVKLHDEIIMTKLPKAITTSLTDIGGAMIGGTPGALIAHHVATEPINNIVTKLIGKPTSKYVNAALLYGLAQKDTQFVGQLIEHANAVAKGEGAISKGIKSLFTAGSQQAVDSEVREMDRRRVQEYIEDGGLNQQVQEQLNEPAPQGFAKGGDVSHKTPEVKPILSGTEGVSTVYPTQSQMLMTAKGRINNYLNGLRPQKDMPGQMPFDTHVPDKHQEAAYKRAVDLSIKPLSILNKVKDGSINIEDMKNFTGLYPELHQHLSKKITEMVVDNQVKGEKPSYKTRQGLSLFLGAPMDSTFKPDNIQAAQNTFMRKNSTPENQPVTKNKKNTSKLGTVATSSMTADQSRQQRQQKV